MVPLFSKYLIDVQHSLGKCRGPEGLTRHHVLAGSKTRGFWLKVTGDDMVQGLQVPAAPNDQSSEVDSLTSEPACDVQ